MLKNAFTPFGASVKARLAESGQTQKWLQEVCHQKTGLYVDSGRMYRVLTGQSKSPRIESAIREVLHMDADIQEAG